MTVKTLGLTHSLDVLWSELVYTEARLLRDKVARDLAPLFVALLRRWEKIANGQRAVWRAEIVAQAGVDLQNLALDETVELIADTLWLAEGKDRTTPRYRRYFAKPPSTVIRLGLENELPVVRDRVSGFKGVSGKAELWIGGWSASTNVYDVQVKDIRIVRVKK